MTKKQPSARSWCPDCPVESVSWHEAALFCNLLTKQQSSLNECYTCSPSPLVTCTPKPGIYTCTGFRLPTDAEWEYAYRAGTTSALYSGSLPKADCATGNASVNAIGWHVANANDMTHLVAQKNANTWGLYDMGGNVAEWCHDDWQQDLGGANATNPLGAGAATNRVVRGGSYKHPPSRMRAADRGVRDAQNQLPEVGFRCVRRKIN